MSAPSSPSAPAAFTSCLTSGPSFAARTSFRSANPMRLLPTLGTHHGVGLFIGSFADSGRAVGDRAAVGTRRVVEPVHRRGGDGEIDAARADPLDLSTEDARRAVARRRAPGVRHHTPVHAEEDADVVVA